VGHGGTDGANIELKMVRPMEGERRLGEQDLQKKGVIDEGPQSIDLLPCNRVLSHGGGNRRGGKAKKKIKKVRGWD